YCLLFLFCSFFFFFFFSSRRRHTRSLRDWSSDVCSSDLALEAVQADQVDRLQRTPAAFLGGNALRFEAHFDILEHREPGEERERSEERRVGKECRSRWSPYQ